MVHKGKSGLADESGWSLLGLRPRCCPEFEDQQLQPAILGLLKEGKIENFSGKKDKDFVESVVDCTIRVLLNWFRQCATSEEQRSMVYKKLSALQKSKAHIIASLFFHIVVFSSAVTKILTHM